MLQANHRWAKLLTLLILTALLLPSPAVAAPTNQSDNAAPIRLQGTTFTPGNGEEPGLPPGLSIAAYNANQRGYYIVQFAGPVQQAWKDQVSALGGEFIAYIPDFAFKVRMNPAQADQVTALESVGWVGIFQPAYKLSPDLKLDGVHVYRVRVEQGADAGLTTAALASSGAEILDRDNNILLVAADAAQVQAVANVMDIAWIENFTINRKHNEAGGGLIMGANSAHANGYDGTGQIAAVADTGIGDGSAGGAHPAIPSRGVAGIFSWTTGNARRCYRVQKDGAQDADSGHGTHVAVSVLGEGGSNGEGMGVAPGASLVFQAVEEYLDIYGVCEDPETPDGYYLIGLPDDLHNLYQQAYDAGARVHSNSWGSSQAGVYTLDSSNTDDFIWDNPKMVVTFSAGNAGTDGNSDGVIDDDSIGSPATAKNVITVGASENDRGGSYPCDTGLGYTSHDAYQPGANCNSMGGQNLLGTYGQRWGADYPKDPIASDLTAGNADQMAAFSSRGPTDDGRIKPDVVAPGTWVLSGYSSLHQEGYGDPINSQINAYQSDGWGMPASQEYKYFGGTSMSNPLTAGAATVIRHFYAAAHGVDASAALVKATLINSAVDMADENNNGSSTNDFPIPNFHEGWGRVNLANATDGSHQFVESGAGLNTGGTASHQFAVDTGGNAFKVTLVWSDYASIEGVSSNLVNDLDLVVTGPGGEVYVGNEFFGGWSGTGGSADRVNNVENVYVQSAATGTWTVNVVGYNVPNGPQPFALVIDGIASGPPVDTPPSVSIINPTDNSQVSGTTTIQISATDLEDADESLTVEWNIDGGAWETADYNGGSGYYEKDWVTTTIGDGGHTLTSRALDSGGNETLTSNSVTVSNQQPAGTVHLAALTGEGTSANRGKWNANVTVSIHDGGHVGIDNVTVTGAWSSGGSDSCLTDNIGQCQIVKNNLKKNQNSTTFTISGITHATNVYEPDDNDADVAVTINKP